VDDGGWKALGVLEITEPGQYQIMHQNGVGLGFRKIGTGELVAGSVRHPCQPCSCCGACGCSGRGRCVGCSQYAGWASRVEEQLQEYYAVLDAPEGWFVQRNTRTIHALGCPALTKIVGEITAVLEVGCTHVDRQWHLPRCPVPIREAQVQAGKRCQVCAPAITLPPPRTGRYAVGGGRE